MHKIKLSMIHSRPYRIEAESTVNGAPHIPGGHVDMLAKKKLLWMAESDLNVVNYVVTFKSVGTNQPVWPFMEKSDGTGSALSNYFGPLVLSQGKTIPLTTKGYFWPVKYDVVATRSDGDPVETLDPVIIIRPGLRSIVEAGLPWAIAGAAVGAAVTWWALTK
jgi:hypothetical protein